MRTRYMLVAALLVFATPLQAQTPDSARAAIVQMRAFIRGADSLATKALTYHDALRVDTIVVRDTVLVVDTIWVEAPAPDTIGPDIDEDTVPAPPTPPDTATVSPPAPPPAPTAGDFPNMPSGWRTIFDDDFCYTWNESMGAPPGWDGIGQGAMPGMSHTVTDTSSPTGCALESIYPPHLSGNGPLRIRKSFGGSYGEVYVSWIVKWEDGFDHNGTSEKHIYLNHPGTGYLLFEQHWRGEALFGITPDTRYYDRDSALRANQEPYGVDGQGLPISPQVDGRWNQYELLFERGTGRVRWWVNGVLHADYSGRSFPALYDSALSTVWGGSGDKQGTHFRRTARYTIAVGN